MPVSVKVCGITNLHDAECATEYGAAYLGLIFVSSSPRCVSAAALEELVKWQTNKPIKLVGVFKDPSSDEVRHAIINAKLAMVQLHGRESVEFCQSIGLPLIKTIEICPGAADALESLRQQIALYAPVAQYLLFDKPKEAGSAKSVDGAGWMSSAIDLIKQVGPIPVPYFFAGGLNADNLSDVVAQLEPFGVDVASGIESRPGTKDLEKMQAFLHCALRQNEASSGGIRS
ncbi:MAG TPA: phosphoribosylanthranilate isomerase [Trichormus sp.]